MVAVLISQPAGCGRPLPVQASWRQTACGPDSQQGAEPEVATWHLCPRAWKAVL